MEVTIPRNILYSYIVKDISANVDQLLNVLIKSSDLFNLKRCANIETNYN